VKCSKSNVNIKHKLLITTFCSSTGTNKTYTSDNRQTPCNKRMQYIRQRQPNIEILPPTNHLHHQSNVELIQHSLSIWFKVSNHRLPSIRTEMIINGRLAGDNDLGCFSWWNGRLKKDIYVHCVLVITKPIHTKSNMIILCDTPSMNAQHIPNVFTDKKKQQRNTIIRRVCKQLLWCTNSLYLTFRLQ
jgi:hypothetical protein